MEHAMTGKEAWQSAQDYFLAHSAFRNNAWHVDNFMVQHRLEVERLVDEYLQPLPQSVLEIGFYIGGTSLLWIALGAKVTAIDIERKDPELVDRLAQEGVLRFVHGDSHSEAVRQQVQGEYDMVFIDGNHSYASVKRDFELYGDMAPQIVFHDIVHKGGPGWPCDVPRLWQELEGDKHEIVVPNSNYGIGVLCR